MSAIARAAAAHSRQQHRFPLVISVQPDLRVAVHLDGSVEFSREPTTADWREMQKLENWAVHAIVKALLRA